jgi:hypothetical protein
MTKHTPQEHGVDHAIGRSLILSQPSLSQNHSYIVEVSGRVYNAQRTQVPSLAITMTERNLEIVGYN